MNEKNFEYLRDQVKYTGFGDGLEAQLKDNLKRQPPEFTLQHQGTFGKDELNSSLHFKRSATTDMYFFNSYTASLKQDQANEKMNQTFYIGKDNNITLKEGYNLMSGRAVNKDLTNKEGKIYNAWLQMDFKQTDNAGNFKQKQFHENYGFKLENELAKHPIKELQNDQERSKLLDSLQKGNRQSVTFLENGSEQRRYIEANPQFKSVTVFDANMHRINNRQSQEASQSKGKSQAQKVEQGLGDDGKDHHSGKKPKKNQGMSVSQ
ncbi:hypothetical protein MUK70_11535 [Dyadobacter chenwenxiniae]|uniref:DUF3945 domain-containing protein n=1 Tax=Dyadobacter chenwenxiniae TaxID=2906456 RepID=A0A9X1PI22_9BACT|nr:hypothetical protein [Dyadobacter chenwenxiniae]MCF0059871.1 hypothetical protein [Dyadobacter chenwenxiniae]UON85611.1 hypothetical protein MUK70_11535 [Dyadobacter chenwenxiniae]